MRVQNIEKNNYLTQLTLLVLSLYIYSYYYKFHHLFIISILLYYKNNGKYTNPNTITKTPYSDATNTRHGSLNPSS